MSSNLVNKKLITYSTQLLSSFESDKFGVEEHLKSFLHTYKDLNEGERLFISEVFGGVIQYDSLLKVVINGYYSSTEGLSCLHSDSSLYYILCYLVMFRLEELGVTQLKRLFSSQNVVEVHKFLRFFLNQDNLKGWIKDQWIRTYDSIFIEENIMAPLSKYESQLEQYLKLLDDKVHNTNSRVSKPTITTTTVKPFDLTQPKPRSVPMPELIPTIPAHKPVPKTTYMSPIESEKISQIRETQKLRAKERLEEANSCQFSCATIEKSDRAKSVIKQIIEEREAKLDYKPVKPVPLPVAINEAQPLKLNTAAILREGARIQKSKEEEEKRLAGLEAGQKDGSEFAKLQEEVKRIESAERLSEQKRRHLKGQLIYEEAIIAKQNSIQETKERVAQMKEESELFMREYFKRQKDERKEMRRLIEATMEGHQNARQAKLKLQQMKHKIVQKIEKEKQEMLQRALEEEEEEMRRKVELIQQIRSMESVPVIRSKFIDLTETGGQGLLAEMSIVELRERLALMKIAKNEEQEKKKKEIATAKQAKEKLINSTVDSIAKHRAETKGKIKKEKDTPPLLLDDGELNELQHKLEMKRKERERLKQVNSKQDTKINKVHNSTTNATHSSPLDTLLRAVTN